MPHLPNSLHSSKQTASSSQSSKTSSPSSIPFSDLLNEKIGKEHHRVSKKAHSVANQSFQSSKEKADQVTFDPKQRPMEEDEKTTARKVHQTLKEIARQELAAQQTFLKRSNKQKKDNSTD